MRQLEYALLNVTQPRDYNTNLISFIVRHQCHHRHLGQLQLTSWHRMILMLLVCTKNHPTKEIWIQQGMSLLSCQGCLLVFWLLQKRTLLLSKFVPGCYRARTNRNKVADILSQEIKKIKERYPYFELDIEQDAVRKPLLVKYEES